jgi:hypothetical protein
MQCVGGRGPIQCRRPSVQTERRNSLKIRDFWDVTPLRLVNRHRWFDGSQWLHLQGQQVQKRVTVEDTGSSGTRRCVVRGHSPLSPKTWIVTNTARTVIAGGMAQTSRTTKKNVHTHQSSVFKNVTKFHYNSIQEERRFVYSDIGRAFLSIKRTHEMKKITVFYIQQYGLVL